MLEILFIAFLCGKIGDSCRRKRRGALGFQIMLVVFWIGGEVLGAVFGVVLGQGAGGMVYLMALIGAGVGATIVFVIVSALPSNAASPTSRRPSMPGGASDWEIQILLNMERDCEQRGDWQQALDNLQQIMSKTTNPQFTVPAQQRYQQIQEWLAQQRGAQPAYIPPRRPLS